MWFCTDQQKWKKRGDEPKGCVGSVIYQVLMTGWTDGVSGHGIYAENANVPERKQ